MYVYILVYAYIYITATVRVCQKSLKTGTARSHTFMKFRSLFTLWVSMHNRVSPRICFNVLSSDSPTPSPMCLVLAEVGSS